MLTGNYDPILLVVALALLALVPFIAVMTTSFVKLVVVFGLLRNALGIQQIPPNMAVHGLAIVLTIYIMAPVALETSDILENENFELTSFESMMPIIEKASQPYRNFLTKYTSVRELQFFEESAHTLWPEKYVHYVAPDSLLILIPSFTVSELTNAFEIGFLLYLPFVVIDLIISNILLAMGMMMVSPMTISLPFKLLLFVLLDGWSRLIHGLVLTYQ